MTSQDVYGVQFDLTYDNHLFRIDSIMTTARTDGFVVYDNIGATPGKVRITTFGMANEVIATAPSSEILYVALTIDSSATPGDYDFVIDNGWESINPDPSYPSLPLVTTAGIVQVDRPGDVNLDKRIDVADLVNIVGYIIGNFGFTPRQFATANVVTDGAIKNVFDLVGVINIIFEIPVQPGPVAPLAGDVAHEMSTSTIPTCWMGRSIT